MRAVITGMGAVTAFGRGVERLWQGMDGAEAGIVPIARFSTDEFAVKIAGVVPDRNDPAVDAGASLCVELAVAAAREAWDGAAATLAALAPARIALVVGTSLGDHELPMHVVTERIGDAIGARGPRLTVSTACTSSTNALGVALDLLEQDAADAVIAGGADVLTPLVLAGFNRLGVLSAAPCAPWSQPCGTSLGEGAGFVVVERGPRPGARHGLLGYGLSADAYHETSPDPSGNGIARALRGALGHAGVAADAIDYVNAHGTGTAAGDPAEWRAIRQVLGARAETVPVSSSKSFLGHAQGAAGVVELIATLAALDRGTVPPTRNFAGARPNSPGDPVAGDRPRPHAAEHVLCNNSGFGGANCAVVVGPPAVASVAAPRRPIYVLGAAAVGPHGAALRQFADGVAAAEVADVAAVVPSADPRGLDPMTRNLLAAAGLALHDAGVKVRGAMQDRSGLVIGTTRVSAASSDLLRRSIDERGLRQLSATMFSRMVLNAPVGACAKQLVLKGPLSTISAGDASGLAAIATAAHLLATRDDADRLLAGGVEEERDEPASRTVDGAACLVLATAPGPAPRDAVRLAGWALAGPDGALDAARAAIAMAGVQPTLLVGPPLPALAIAGHVHPAPRAGAASSALAAVIAVAALRRGDATCAIAIAEPSASATCALLFVRDVSEPGVPS